MSRSVREYLKHIRDEITYLEGESTDIDKDDFLDDETRKRAFVRSIEVIGEASKKKSLRIFEMNILKFNGVQLPECVIV